MGRVDDMGPGRGRISGQLSGPGTPSPRRRPAPGPRPSQRPPGRPPGRPRSRLADAPTTILAAIRPDRVKTVLRTSGELLITAGLVLLLFVIYEVYVTDLISAGKQRDATAALDKEWRTDSEDPQRRDHFEGLKEGEGFAKMYIPVFGADYSFTILEGTTAETLEVGPGHYVDTAYPGQPGNFSVAGHRVGKGAPFNDLDLLSSCDAIIVETRYAWFTYRVMPMANEKGNWARTRGRQQRCEGVNPGAAYSEVVGREIVAPSAGTVIDPVPHNPNADLAPRDQAELLTLTTCHPRFSDKQRMIVHAVLVERMAKNPDKPNLRPDAFGEG